MTDSIELRLHARLGSFELDVDLNLPATGVTALFGPSGSGKTTVLRCVAGLTRADEAKVRVRADWWENSEERRFVPTHRRRVGYVFQEAALLPHLSVRRNIEYASRRARHGAHSRVPVDSFVEWFRLEPLLHRRPAALSGGEKQRVAMARALAAEPAVLLMDEPLSSLDVNARAEILSLLEKLHRDLDVPIVYVTHALDELVHLCDRVVWLDAGTVRATGSVSEILGRLDFAATLGDDAGSSVDAVVRLHDEPYHLTELDSAWGPIFTHRLDANPGDAVRVHVRARDVSIGLRAEERSSILNVLPAIVEDFVECSPGEVLLRLACPADPHEALLARVTKKSADRLGVGAGDRVFARVKSVSVR